MQGTEGADGPFFSPDGRWIGYTAQGKLYKVAVTGGAPVLLSDSGAGNVASGAWLLDNRIVFSSNTRLQSVPAGGGKGDVLEPPGSRASSLVFPQTLPRKDAILVTECITNCIRMTLEALHFGTLKRDTVLAGAARGWYLPTGDLVAVLQDGTLVGAPFDLEKLRFKSQPVPLLTGINLELGIIPQMSIADDGTLVYLPVTQSGAGTSTSLIARVGRDGKAAAVDPGWKAAFSSLALSPDGRRLAVSILTGSDNQLWVKQLDSGPLTRLTLDGTLNYRAAWHPDGRTLSFTSNREAGLSHLYDVRADGSSKPERIFPTDTNQVDEAEWSRDGRWVVYRTGVSAGFRDIYARGLQGDTTRITVAAGSFDEYMPALSPDGRWIAYVSEESGQEEVYVRPFPGTDRARWQLSTGGGVAPAWAHSGRELFYVNRLDSLIAVEVSGDDGLPCRRQASALLHDILRHPTVPPVLRSRAGRPLVSHAAALGCDRR